MEKEYFKPVLLRWILTISLISLGIVALFSTGVAGQINEVDFTKISFAILGMFILFTLRTGKLTYEACKISNRWPSVGKHEAIKAIIHKNETGWFWSDAFVGAGMIGTVIGFILMMSGSFDNVTGANIQNVIVVALSRMGLALYTTAAGLICSLLLKIQLFNLAQYLDRLD